MFLIREEIERVQFLSEGEGAEKKLYIKGPFLCGETKNRNNRIYPMGILEPEAQRYIREQVAVGSGWGELSHPNSPQINPDRVSHRTISLVREGNDFIGKAIIVNNPSGLIVKGLLESGGRVGVSSRGLGSLKENSMGILEVQPDYRIATCADVVLDPSGPTAWINGILEGVQFTVTSDGQYVQEETKKELKRMSLRQISEQKERAFANFIQKLTKK